MSHEVESMFYVNEPVWHNLGVRVDQAPTSEEAIKIAGLDWEVIQLPIFVNNLRVKEYVANVRSTDGKVLGIVGSRYKVVQNKEAFAFTDALLGEGVRYETAGSLREGKRVWLLARLPETKILGDDVEPYLVFTNGHDGFFSVRVAITPIRVVCMNTLNAALREAKRSWATKHVGDIQGKLEEAERTLELANNYLVKLNKEAEELVRKKVSTKLLEKIVERLIPMPDDASERQKKNIEETRAEIITIHDKKDDLANIRNTAWGVFNAVSNFVTHMQPKRKSKTFRERHFEKIIDGHNLLDKAYELLKAA